MNYNTDIKNSFKIVCHMKNYIIKLTTKMDILNLLKIIGLTISSFLVPIQGFILILLLLVVADTAFGIYAAIKRGEKITSNKLFNTVIKLFFYELSVILAYLIDYFVFGGVFPLFHITNGLSKGVTLYWAWIELKSIDENQQKLGGKPFQERIKEMFKFAKGLKEDLTDITKDKKEGE